MAAITSAQSGFHDVPSTWVGGVVPGIGDNVILANGHTVTQRVGTSWTVGDSANPTTHAIRTAGTGGTGRLIVNGTLTVLGDILQGNATWEVVGAGATVQSGNTTTALVWYLSDVTEQLNARIVVTGTGSGANRAVIRRGVGATGFRITTGGGNNAGMTATWALFRDLGDASTDGIRLAQWSFGASVMPWDMTDVWVDGCGCLAHNIQTANSAPFRWERVSITNTPETGNALNLSWQAANGTATWYMRDVAVRRASVLMTMGDVTTSVGQIVLERCFFDARGRTYTVQRPASYTDCLIAGQQPVIAANWTRGFFTHNDAALNNWHATIWSRAGTYTLDGAIFDAVTDGQAVGDAVAPGANVTLTARNCLGTRAPGATATYGKFISLHGAATTVVSAVENNTWTTDWSGEGGMVGVGETYAGYTGMLGSIRNNLAASVAAQRGTLITRQSTGANNNIRDYALPANVTNNCVQSPGISATNGNGNFTVAGGDGVMWSSVPAAHLAADPQFVDPTRNLATWYRSVVGGTPGTRTADMDLAFDAICSQFTDSPVAGATIPNAWAWIRAGFAPQNPALRASSTGGWIGAVDGRSGGRRKRSRCVAAFRR